MASPVVECSTVTLREMMTYLKHGFCHFLLLVLFYAEMYKTKEKIYIFTRLPKVGLNIFRISFWHPQKAASRCSL